tara:strand:- start:127 stop:573 length:447 start_codon:yes stop_codon:yes gene_type:complete
MDTLILSCTASKRGEPSQALDLYLSRAFDLVRSDRARFHVQVLSAFYGLLEADEVIDPYNQKMTPAIAAELMDPANTQMARAINRDSWSEVIYVYGGELYRKVVLYWAWEIGRPVVELVGPGRGCGDHYSALKRLFSDEEGARYELYS